MSCQPEGDGLFGVVGGFGYAVAGMARSYGWVVVCELAIAGMAQLLRGRDVVGAVDGVADAVGEVGFAGGAGEANVDEAFAVGEDDAAVLRRTRCRARIRA